MLYDYEYFKREVFALTGIDLSSYKENQMKRRIDTLIAKHQIIGYDKYVQMLRTDTKKFEEFVSYLTINVSEFYRDPQQWKVLEHDIIPDLIRKFGKNLRIWSAACSTGDEPYSLVMALSRYLPLGCIKVYATDIDRQVLEQAKAGLYQEKSIASVPEELKRKYFSRSGSAYQISAEIRSRVEFGQHNLLRDTYPGNYHLIVCRNVLIYFTEEAKQEVYAKFFRSLAAGGILFAGSAEQMMYHADIGFVKKYSLYYEKPS